MADNEKTILILEDQFLKDANLGADLEERGMKTIILQAESTDLEQVVKTAPDIIISDLDQQNQKDPFHLISAMKNDDRLKDSEIFILSDNIDVSTEIKLRRLKLHSYFLKDRGMDAVIEAALRWFNRGQDEALTSQQEREKILREKVLKSKAEETGKPLAGAGVSDESISDATVSDGEFDQLLAEMQDGVSTAIDSREEENDDSYSKGIALLEENNEKEAVDELLKVSGERKPAALLALGKAWRGLGEHQKSINSLKEGFTLSDSLIKKLEFRYEMGETLEDIGKLKEAYKTFATIYKNDKDYKDVKQRLLKLQKLLKEAKS